ncbi:MAG: alpha-amylase family glycosyl hydrolase, partial [Promicromonosporaceae bacterium]|nr:alpha-amylase family glycosyl hydrolase [Promicromonosporaceae bacterium]
WNMLSSHDSPRIRTVTGSARLVEAAAALLIGLPRTPVLFMGEEGGFTGSIGEAGRRTMPWDQVASGGGPDWDGQAFESWRALIAARQGSPALQAGGLRWVHVGEDAVAFLRETSQERVLVVVARTAWEGLRLPAWLREGEVEVLVAGVFGAPELTDHADSLAISGDPGVGVYRLA